MGQKKLAGRCGLKSGWEMEMREKDSMGVKQVTSASLPLTCGESALSCWRCSGADGLSTISWRSWKASWGSVYSCSSVETIEAQIRDKRTPSRKTVINSRRWRRQPLTEQATLWLTCLVVVLHGIEVIVIQLGIAEHILRMALAAFRLLVFWKKMELNVMSVGVYKNY